MINQELVSFLNESLCQKARFRKGGTQALYFCKCGHKKRKLELNLNSLIYHCWVCNSGGYIIDLFKLFNISHLLPKLYPFLPKCTPKQIVSPTITLGLPVEFISLAIDNPKNPIYKNAAFYLKTRNIDKIDIIRYNIGYCEDGPYKNHIIIPSYDYNQKLNFFIGRRFYKHDTGISYKKPSISNDIIGFENLINYNYSELTLVEGGFDAIAVRNNAVPLFGKYISKKLKCAIINHNIRRINICLDNDAIAESIKLYLDLKSLGVEQIHLIQLKDKDPSVIGFKNIHHIINSSTPTLDEDILKLKLKL